MEQTRFEKPLDICRISRPSPHPTGIRVHHVTPMTGCLGQHDEPDGSDRGGHKQNHFVKPQFRHAEPQQLDDCNRDKDVSGQFTSLLVVFDHLTGSRDALGRPMRIIAGLRGGDRRCTTQQQQSRGRWPNERRLTD